MRLTCKRKTVKRQRSAEEKATGVVEWAVEIFNQHQQAVALYSILTTVARQQGDFWRNGGKLTAGALLAVS